MEKFVHDPCQVSVFMAWIFQLVKWGKIDPRFVQWAVGHPMETTMRPELAKFMENWQDRYCREWRFPVWKEFNTGIFTCSASYFTRLWGEQVEISPGAAELLKSGSMVFGIPSIEKKVALVKTNSQDLGISEGASLEEAMAAGIASGLSLCPKTTGPELRFSFPEIPRVGTILVFSEWIGDGIFTLARGELGKLERSSGLRPGDELVFAKE